MVLTIFFGILGFGIMVFIHELGHFLAAKLSGIEVEVFSLGWGKKMIGFTHRGTSYQISWFPVGGYCKMKGDELAKPRERGAEQEAPPLQPGSFFAASPARRILVAAAGPLANVSFAVIVLTIIWWVGFNIHTDSNRIILAPMEGSPAMEAGLRTGDRITAVNGQPVRNFQDILERIAVAPDKDLRLELQRDGQTLTVPITPELDLQTGAGKIGVYAWRDPLIDEVRPGSPASLAGLQPGDLIVEAEGQPVRHTIDLYDHLEDRPSRLDLVVERHGQRRSAALVMRYADNGVADLGLSFRQELFREPGRPLPAALGEGLGETWRTLTSTVRGIGLLFRGIDLQDAVAGPLRITYYVGSVATSGFSLGFGEGMVSFFRFLCLLSVVLFLMNLLPIPALDGGQIIVFLVEIVRGRRVNPVLVNRIQIIGFSMLMILAVFITFSDILYFLGR